MRVDFPIIYETPEIDSETPEHLEKAVSAAREFLGKPDCPASELMISQWAQALANGKFIYLYRVPVFSQEVD